MSLNQPQSSLSSFWDVVKQMFFIGSTDTAPQEQKKSEPANPVKKEQDEQQQQVRHL